MEQTMNPTTRFWDDIAEKYAKKPVPNPSAYQRKLEITKAKLDTGDVILDIGCGTGSLALELAPHVAQVHGLDISGEMVRIAKKRADGAQAHNVNFHQTTFDTSPAFSRESFDGICAYNILHLVDEPDAALANIFDLLKPDGFFVSSTPCLSESWVPFRAILPVMRWLGKAPEVQFFRMPSWLDQIRSTGFIDLVTPDVGADKMTAFVVAKKPELQA